MQMNTVLKLGMAALLVSVLAACSSTGSDTGQSTTTPTTGTGGNNTADNGRAATPQGAGGTQSLTPDQLREQQMLAVTVFYFDFDKSDLKPEAREALVYHANRLKANPGMHIRLEGHADERGTREYNLALGERRAQAVERYLLVQGVPSSQMETISYGEERPVDTGTTEAAYAKNRRVEIH